MAKSCREKATPFSALPWLGVPGRGGGRPPSVAPVPPAPSSLAVEQRQEGSRGEPWQEQT